MSENKITKQDIEAVVESVGSCTDKCEGCKYNNLCWDDFNNQRLAEMVKFLYEKNKVNLDWG